MSLVRVRLPVLAILALMFTVSASPTYPQPISDGFFRYTDPPPGTRLETQSPGGDRTGYVESQRGGRFDVFTPDGKRQGYGEINRYGDGKIDLYDNRGNRTGIVSPPSGRGRGR